MKTIEWNCTRWWLVQWERTGHLQMQGTFIRPLKSARKEDAETEAMLQGWL